MLGTIRTPRLQDRVIVRKASDLTNIDSTKEYFIDGAIDMGNQSIEVPSTGIHLGGYGFDISKLFSSEENYTLFTSPVGGSGNIFIDGMTLTTSGTGAQVYDITSASGFDAIEVTTVNYDDCSSLGEITNYRQGLEENTGRFGGEPTLTLSGTWVGGFRASVSIVRNLSAGMTGPLFKAGPSFTMASRFLTDANVDLPATASFADFSTANFTGQSLFQLRGCSISRNGMFDPSDPNILPNISAQDLECLFKNNKGIRNTFIGGELTITTETTTTINSVGAFETIAGTWTPTELTHFSASGGTLTLEGGPLEYTVYADHVYESTTNDTVTLRLMKIPASTGTPEEIRRYSRIVSALSGARDVATFNVRTSVSLEDGDQVYLEVANDSSTSNVTLELGSYHLIKER